MKKLLTIMTALVLTLAVAMPVMAAENFTVEDNTAEDSLNTTTNPTSKLDVDENGNMTLTYSAADLKTVKAQSDIGRTIDAAWLGFKITVPETYKKFTSTFNGTTSEKTEVKENTVIDYVAVTKEKLAGVVSEGGENLVYTITYNWYGDNDEEPAKTTTLKVVIKAEGVKLTDGVGNEGEVWNESIYAATKPAPTPETNTNNKKPAKEEKAEEDEKDDTANTGVENVYVVAGLVAVVTLAGAVVLNKRK